MYYVVCICHQQVSTGANSGATTTLLESVATTSAASWSFSEFLTAREKKGIDRQKHFKTKRMKTWCDKLVKVP